MHGLFFHVGHPAVVEDERHLGAAPDQLGDLGDLVVPHAEVEGETGVGECVADANPFYSSETTRTPQRRVRAKRTIAPSVASGRAAASTLCAPKGLSRPSAMAAGASDNGAPGIRAHYHENYYAAFVRTSDDDDESIPRTRELLKGLIGNI